MGQSLGQSLVTNCPVENLDVQSLTVNGKWKADKIISTIPWTVWPTFCQLKDNVKSSIALLQNTSVDVDYHSETVASPAHWIYEPDEAISYHRLLLRSNFINGAHGHWTETNSRRAQKNIGGTINFHNEYAYPINTIEKPESIGRVLAWANSHSILGLGRWGKWEHMNSDVAVAEAMQMAKDLILGSL